MLGVRRGGVVQRDAGGLQAQAEDLERLIGRYQFDQALQSLQALRQRMTLATGSN